LFELTHSVVIDARQAKLQFRSDDIFSFRVRRKNFRWYEPSPTVVINLSAKIFGSTKFRERVTLIPKKLEQAGLNEKKFDRVMISNVMPYIHDDRERERMLKTAGRIIKIDGKLIVTFFALSMMHPGKKTF
jgi:hypothetical protein